MERSGIPGVNADAVKYVQRALLPDHSDAEATAVFTKYVRVFCSYVIVHAVGGSVRRMIEQCLTSSFTQINFFLHNLAQKKFAGHSEGALLSFIPKTYSLNTDGRIVHIELVGYQKRYNPEKYDVRRIDCAC